MSTKRRSTEKQVPKENSIYDVFRKAFRADSDWEDKDEFLDVVYWMRQVIGFVIGIVWGVVPLKGILGILIFFAINIVIVYFYCNSFQRVDEEEFGGFTEIVKEGLMTSFVTFLVAWIFVYSALYFE